MRSAKLLIDQNTNYGNDFGEVFRSSAIFYYKYSAGFKTTISLLNYWKLKRNISVGIIGNVRDLSGKLIKRQRLYFENCEVINFSPKIETLKDFEGSVEIEVFSTENLVIPYAAVMCIYETTNGPTMVHSYTRAYSQHEIEDGRTITSGEESCWTLRDDNHFESFGVIHNGPQEMVDKHFKLVVKNHSGQKISKDIYFEKIEKYQTIVIRPKNYIIELVDFLENRPGQAALSFVTGDSFTRMLVGNRKADDSDWQVTHSNFNYSVHMTNKLNQGNNDLPSDYDYGYMKVPHIPNSKLDLYVYPDNDPGNYELLIDTKKTDFSTGQFVNTTLEGSTVKIRKLKDLLPSRVVTAISGRLNDNTSFLPFECSIGISTKAKPPKRLWWGSIAFHSNLKTKLYIIPNEVLSGPSSGFTIDISIYSQHHKTSITSKITVSNEDEMLNGVDLEKLFPNIKEYLKGSFGYYSTFSEYKGFSVYSLIYNDKGIATLEHGF